VGLITVLELGNVRYPNTHDSAPAVVYAYSNSVVADESDGGGITQILDPNPQFPFPGVEFENVGGSMAGTVELAVFPGPPLSMAVSDVGMMTLGSPVDVSASGLFTLLSPAGVETIVTVNATVVAQAVPSPEQISVTVTPSLRSCFQVSVQNIKLVATLGTGGVDGGVLTPGGTRIGPIGPRPADGWNVVNVFMGEVLNGDPNAPTVYRAESLPFQFIPPNQKTPPQASVRIEQTDLTTLITN
jgi:hypothetical protein